MHKYEYCTSCKNSNIKNGECMLCIKSEGCFPSKYMQKLGSEGMANEKSIVYSLRAAGQNYCQTKGSEHYKKRNIEPIDLIVEEGMLEDFCLANIIKYAARFKHDGGNLEDLKKIADYAHILCGYRLSGITQYVIDGGKDNG